MRLKDKVAIVTGGASGIGRAVAIGFAKEGCSVAVVDINKVQADAVVEQIVKDGGNAIGIYADVSGRAETDRMVKETLDEYGKIDILVTSAGVLEEISIQDMTVEKWDKMIDTDVNGVMYSTQSVLEHMVPRKYGKIVIISSIAAIRGRANQVPYCAAEGTLSGFAANAAIQMGEQGIYVNAIEAGIIDTDFPESLKETPEYRDFRIKNTPLRRIGQPEDIVGPALFLASDDSNFVTGESLIVDGGINIYTNGYGL